MFQRVLGLLFVRDTHAWGYRKLFESNVTTHAPPEPSQRSREVAGWPNAKRHIRPSGKKRLILPPVGVRQLNYKLFLSFLSCIWYLLRMRSMGTGKKEFLLLGLLWVSSGVKYKRRCAGGEHCPVM